jgi:hypothetical protein
MRWPSSSGCLCERLARGRQLEDALVFLKRVLAGAHGTGHACGCALRRKAP